MIKSAPRTIINSLPGIDDDDDIPYTADSDNPRDQAFDGWLKQREEWREQDR